MIKMHFAALLPAAAFLTAIHAPPALAQESDTAAAPETAGPALWKVADEDTTIYLFGTVHALPEGLEWYRGDVADALASSDALVTEIEMDAAAVAQMQAFIGEQGMLPAGETLRGLMDEEERAAYEKALAGLGLPAAAFDRYEPWYAAMMLATLPLLKQGYSADAGVEKVLEMHAAGKTRGALETVVEQLTIFDGLPRETQLRFMEEAAAGVADIKPLLDQMVAEWAEGDADELARLMNEDMDDPVLAERLIYARNAAWAKWIDGRLDQPGTVFVAVGAGHLAGKGSVQDELAELDIATSRIQ